MNNDSQNKNPNELLIPNHEADGIHELDNLLPRWWVWLFYLTILFSAGYMGYYHVLKAGELQAAEYSRESRHGDEIKAASLAKFEASIGNLTPDSDKAVFGKGQMVYAQMCAPCHRPDGGGLVGPNLTDDYWIHGSNYVDTVKTIVNGVPEKGMLTWRGVLKPNEIQSVASYIYTLRGTKPPNPKVREDQAAPQKPNEYE
jgi:cytochrome c oxidase cbb3-type subunit III